jgi:hypothetical protein
MAQAASRQRQLSLDAGDVNGKFDREGARRALTRRRFVLGAAALAAGGAAAGVAIEQSSGRPAPVVPHVPLGRQPDGLPARQHAWTATLPRDADGNPVAPRYDRLLFFDVNGGPTPAHARLLEAALRTLERSYRWGPDGLLFTAGWGTGYFERTLRVSSPIPRAQGLSEFELPAIDDYDLCLHFACDDEDRLADVEAALIHGEALPDRSSSPARCAGARRGPASSVRASRPSIRESVAYPRDSRWPRMPRCSWGSSRA